MLFAIPRPVVGKLAQKSIQVAADGLSDQSDSDEDDDWQQRKGGGGGGAEGGAGDGDGATAPTAGEAVTESVKNAPLLSKRHSFEPAFPDADATDRAADGTPFISIPETEVSSRGQGADVPETASAAGGTAAGRGTSRSKAPRQSFVDTFKFAVGRVIASRPGGDEASDRGVALLAEVRLVSDGRLRSLVISKRECRYARPSLASGDRHTELVSSQTAILLQGSLGRKRSKQSSRRMEKKKSGKTKYQARNSCGEVSFCCFDASPSLDS